MTTFQDGPARGQCLMLKRSPNFLRVVLKGKTWDALDRLDDHPDDDEQIHVYIRKGAAGMCHVHKRGGGGFYSMAAYKYAPVQPSESEMRSVESWRAWCLAQVQL